MQSRGSPWHFLHDNTGLDTTASFLPAIGKKDQHQFHSALPQIHVSHDDSKQKSRRSKWHSQQKDIEAELQRELESIEQAEAALSQLGARKTQPASFGHPRPAPKPRFVKSTRIQPVLPPTEASAPPRWSLSEDLLGKKRTPDQPLPPAASQENEAHVHAPKESWQAKARELEQIASEYRWQHEQEKHRREAAMAQDVGQQQNMPHYVDDEQACQKEQLEERVREIRRREEQRLEEMKQAELRRANKEREDAMKRRQAQEDWEKKLRQRMKEEAEQLKTEREKDNLLLQQRAEAMQKQWEEQKERFKEQQEQEQRQRKQAETQRSQANAGRGFRMDASPHMPEHAPYSHPKPSFSHGPAPPKMPVPPSPRCPSIFQRPQQPHPRPSPHESAWSGASQPGRTVRSPCDSESTPKISSVGCSCEAATSGSSADLQAAKAAAMREMLSLKKHPGFEARQKGYKELLRAWHPDKNLKNASVATAVFQMLQMEKGRILDS